MLFVDETTHFDSEISAIYVRDRCGDAIEFYEVKTKTIAQ